jgi:uncharacterized protein YbcI
LRRGERLPGNAPPWMGRLPTRRSWMTAITDRPTKGALARQDISARRTSKRSKTVHEPQASAHPATAASPELERRHAKLGRAEPTVSAGAGALRASPIARPPGSQTGAPRDPTASPTLEIANAIVGAYKDALGRGPTKSRVHFAGADTLVVVLEDTMTVQERNLAALGEEEPLREYRLVLTRALEDRFRSIVERAIGRRTVAFVSGFDTLRDVAVEVFTLTPESTDGQTAVR